MVVSYKRKSFTPFGQVFKNLPPKTCPQCNKAFGRSTKDGKVRTVRDFTAMKFCSKSCASENAKIHNTESDKRRVYRSVNKEKIRSQSRERYARQKAEGTLTRTTWYDGKGPVCACGSEKFSTKESRKHEGYVYRVRSCDQCGDKTHTIEIPESEYDKLNNV